MKSTFIRALAVAAFVFVSASFLVGCSGGGGSEEKEYRIGAILSVTGKASFLGEPEKKTLEMLVAKLNAEGGINGVPVKLIIEDDEGREEKTKMAVSRLVDKEGVLAIIGPSRSGNTMSIKQMVEEKETAMISLASAEEIIDPVSGWVFKVAPNDSFVADGILKHANENGIKYLAVLYGNTGFGQLGMKQLEKYAGNYGVTIVMKESYQPMATDEDMAILLTKIKGNPEVQAIVNWSILPAQSVVSKKMHELGMDKMTLYCSHGFANISYVKNAGAAADGVLFPAQRLIVADLLPDTNPQKQNLVVYKNMYETEFGEDVSTFGGHAYDAFHILVKAIEKAGDDKQLIRDEIEKTDGFAGAGGVFTFSPEDHGGLDADSLEMITIQSGRFVPLVSVSGD